MNYENAKILKQTLERENEILSDELKEFSKHENEIGLLPESVRLSPRYREVKKKYDESFTKLRNYNTWFLRQFKKEYMEDRRRNRFKK